MIVALALTILTAMTTPSPVESAAPAYFAPPKGWSPMQLPPGAPVDFAWLSPNYHPSGENITVTVRTVPAGATLDSEVREATAEAVQDGKSVATSQAYATCAGSEPGWTIDIRVRVTATRVVSQLQHIAVHGDKAYVIMYTHTAGSPIEKDVYDSIGSLCPATRT